MKLYDSKLAPNPRRVRIFMAEKGISCDEVQIDIVKGENLTTEFLAINPRGVLPTLVLGDKPNDISVSAMTLAVRCSLNPNSGY